MLIWSPWIQVIFQGLGDNLVYLKPVESCQSLSLACMNVTRVLTQRAKTPTIDLAKSLLSEHMPCAEL